MRIVLALAILLLSPAMAFAHTGADHAAGLVHGFAHPIGGLDHVLAMVAVGILAFALGGRALWLVPASFVGMMVVGFILGLLQTTLPYVELAIALSSVVIGAAAVSRRPIPLALATSLVGLFAVFHGHAHGGEMPADSSGLTYALGFVAATALLHLSGIAATFGLGHLVGRHRALVSRFAGGLFAVAGLGVMAGWL